MNDPTAFRLDGGAVWLNFLGTQGQSFSARPVERLSSPERLAVWLSRMELAPRVAPGEDDLAAARRLRESLRALALAVLAGAPPPSAEFALVSALAPVPAPTILDSTLRRPPPDDTAAALARIAAQALDHLSGVDRHQLRICAEHDCQWVFLDTSGRRRWCPSPACASRGRVRAHRARHATP